MSNPRIAIFGWHNFYSILYDRTIQGAHKFDFTFAGSASDFVKLESLEAERYKNEYDAVILHAVGSPASWALAPSALALMGGKAKVAIWCMDCHNDGWVAWSIPWANKFDAWYVAHSPYMASIGGNVMWMPCYLPYTFGYDFQQPMNRCRDVALAGMSYPKRDAELNKIKAYMDHLGLTYFVGTYDKSGIPDLYRTSRCVLNVNQNTDLNLRQFEALGAGTPVIMTPSLDWHNPIFSDLWPFVAEIPHNPTYDQFESTFEIVSKIDASSSIDIVRKKHQLINRYISICEQIL